jgi:hypothetical protein
LQVQVLQGPPCFQWWKQAASTLADAIGRYGN